MFRPLPRQTTSKRPHHPKETTPLIKRRMQHPEIQTRDSRETQRRTFASATKPRSEAEVPPKLLVIALKRTVNDGNLARPRDQKVQIDGTGEGY